MSPSMNGNQIHSTTDSRSNPNKTLYLCFGLIILLAVTTVALIAATLGVVVNRLNSNNTQPNNELSFVNQIQIEELLKHLQQLQMIADQSNGTRAIATFGFNGTLDYITTQLEQNTNLIIQHQYFTVRNYILRGTPQLQSQVNGVTNNYTYLTDFAHMVFSASASLTSFVPLVVIPNLGCTDADWSSVAATDAIALVKRGSCTFPEKITFAENHRVKGLLIYNDETSGDPSKTIPGLRSKLNTLIPIFFLSYNVGMKLISESSANIGILMNADMIDAEGVRNICADTPSGDKTKTIIVGAHSDSVPAGSGINDNGSGTMGVLVLALNLARLFQTSSNNYPTYPYRVRFCWWGAEELGLIGSIYHVEQALSVNTKEGERFQDYLVNLNYDMLAGPNYRFGIHDNRLVPASTPPVALNGTSRITSLLREWFNEQKLPWSNSSMGGGSDYVPFLANGLAAGGVNTGAGGLKSPTERDQYSSVLGIGNGGIANAAFDPCYHQQCDRINNVNPFAYEKVVKSAAYAIEYMGRLNNLEKWLYPEGRPRTRQPITREQLFTMFKDTDIY